MTPANSQVSPAGCQGAANGKSRYSRGRCQAAGPTERTRSSPPGPARRRCAPPRCPARQPPGGPIRRCRGWVEEGYPVPPPTEPALPDARPGRRVPLRTSAAPRSNRLRAPPSGQRWKRMALRSGHCGGQVGACQPRRHPFVMGRRRSRPNALAVILTPGGAWRRLYSLRSTMRATLVTISRS